MADFTLTYQAKCVYDYIYRSSVPKGGVSHFSILRSKVPTNQSAEKTYSSIPSQEEVIKDLDAICKTKLAQLRPNRVHAKITKTYAIEPWLKSIQEKK